MEKQIPPKTAGTPLQKPAPTQETKAPKVAQTEDFTMSNEESDAADVLLSQEETAAQEAADPTSTREGEPTEAFVMKKKPAPPAAAAKPAAAKPLATPAAAPQAASAGQKTLGDYRLIKKLGQGGMGAVYLAHQISLDRPVALKVLTKELAGNPTFVQRFTREARVMAKLDHPNILRCYEVREIQGFHCLAIEFVEGGSLGDWVKKLRKFSLGDSLYTIIVCAQALQHAHELSLIHRDIKPDNILLTKRGVIKVADLGLAKATDDDLGLTKTGAGAGTPLYMAPEQARDAKHVDHRSDIYALGCMLYMFLTGNMPFTGETLVQVIEAKEKGKFKPARHLNDDVPERLDLIIDKMLTPKPEHRYQSCAQLLLDLEGLGLAHSQLSFIQVEGPPKQPSAPPPKKVSAPQMTSAPPARSTAKPSAATAPADYWFASFTTKDGKAVTRKMTADEIVGQIRSKAFDAETQLSKTLKGGYRALGTYPEFQHLMKAALTTHKAERKAEKFKSFYAQIDKQEKSRQRWRWLHNKFLGIGGFIGFVLWLAVLAGIGIGLYFAAIWLWPILQEKLGLG